MIRKSGRREFLRKALFSAVTLGTTSAAFSGCGSRQGTLYTTNGSGTSSRGYRISRLFDLPVSGRSRTRQVNPTGIVGARLGKINNVGEVAAQLFLADEIPTAGIYRNGNLINANAPHTGFGNFPLDLNDRSQLLVTQIDSLYRLYLWDNGVTSRVELPYRRFEYFFGGAMNNLGQIVGQAATEFSATGEFLKANKVAYFWSDGDFKVIGPDPSGAAEINDAGQIVGWLETPRAAGSGEVVLWPSANEAPISLGAFGRPVALGEDGTVLINLEDKIDGQDTALWIPDRANGTSGTLRPLPTPVSPRTSTTSTIPGGFNASGMNVHRDVVGTAFATFGTGAFDSSNPYLLKSGSVNPIDLNTLIDATTGWDLTDASGINDRGQITGQGWYTDTAGTRSRSAFLLTPV